MKIVSSAEKKTVKNFPMKTGLLMIGASEGRSMGISFCEGRR